MPRLPDYTALGESPVARPASGIASYEPSMRHTGEGLLAAGQDIQQATSIVAETNQRQDAIVAEAALNQLQARRLDLEAGQGGFRNVHGQNAVGPAFLDAYQQKFTDAASSLEEGLQNDYQKRLFKQRVPLAGLQYRAALLSHQSTETDHFNEQTENDSMDLARRQIFLTPNDPDALRAGVAQINWGIDQKGKRMGWAPEVVAETKLKYLQNVADDAAALQVARDPVGSLTAMNKRLGIGQEAGPSGALAFDNASAERLVMLHRHAETYVRVADNQQRAELTRRLRDAEDAFGGLRDFSITGALVSPAYEQQVLGQVAGTPFEAPARQLLNASLSGAMHGTQPLPAQQTNLRQLDAATQQVGASPEEKKVIDHMRAITQTQTEAYKENPWAAAARFGRQQDVPEAAISDAAQVPQVVAGRLPLMNAVETYAGVPVSPLQPGEAKAWVEKLRALPPDPRADVVGQTGAMLSGPRAMALANQIDKHDRPLALSLKLGLDRTTDGRAAASLIQRGAQALEDKTVKKDDSALAGWRAEIATLVRGTLGDDQMEQDVIDAAYYARAALDVEGVAPAGMKAGPNDALAVVLGLPFERQGVKSFLPRNMVNAGAWSRTFNSALSAFDDKLETYTPERLRELAPSGQLFSRGQPVSVEQFAARIRSYGMRYAGRGRYVPTVNNAPMTLDAQGTQPLMLEVK